MRAASFSKTLTRLVWLIPLAGVLLAAPLAARAGARQGLVEKGLALIKDGRYKKAVAVLTKAAVADPENHKAWGLLGLAFTLDGQYKKGLAATEKALRVSPLGSRVLAHYWGRKGIALFHLGRYKEAAAYLAKALERLPGDTEYRRYLHRAQRAGEQRFYTPDKPQVH